MLYSDTVPLIYVNDTICMVICPSSRFKLIILWPKINHLYMLWVRGLVPFWVLRHSFLSLTDCWWLYNIQPKTSRGVLFLSPSDAYVRSFLYLLYTLIKLYYTKLWVIKPRLWPRIEFFSSGGQESWCRNSTTTFQGLGDGKNEGSWRENLEIWWRMSCEAGGGICISVLCALS